MALPKNGRINPSLYPIGIQDHYFKNLMIFPESNIETLAEFIQAVKKRRKALSYKFREIACVKVIEIDNKIETQKIELTLRKQAKSLKSFTIKLFLWEDRWVFIDLRIGQKIGWKFEWTRQGRLAGHLTSSDLVALIEKSDALIFDVETHPPFEDLRVLWHGVLLNGPFPITLT